MIYTTVCAMVQHVYYRAFEFERRSASGAIFRARAYSHTLFSPVMMIIVLDE